LQIIKKLSEELKIVTVFFYLINCLKMIFMIDKVINSQKKTISNELRKFFNLLTKREEDILFKDFISEFKGFILNKQAKRLHPILLMQAFKGIINPLYLQDEINEIRKVAISVEFLHNAHLIQDDLVDDDQYRRGTLTLHYLFKNELEKILKSDINEANLQTFKRYGMNVGLLGGTFSYLLGIDIIKNSNFAQNLKLMAIKEYSEAIGYVLKGQIIEEYLNAHNITMTIEQYLNIAEMIRARVFEKSAKIGAILAKGNLHYQIEPLSEAMLKIGQVHTIMDDVIDITEDIKGKKKNKFPYLLTLNNINERQGKILNEIYNKSQLTESDVKQVKDIFSETNAIQIAKQFSKNLINQAQQNLEQIYPDLNKEQKDFFNEFADYIFETGI
jgi:octaprenyl-diphosphate synthase